MKSIKNNKINILAIIISLVVFCLINILALVANSLLKNRYSNPIDLIELVSVLQYLSWLICGYLSGVISKKSGYLNGLSFGFFGIITALIYSIFLYDNMYIWYSYFIQDVLWLIVSGLFLSLIGGLIWDIQNSIS
jgi:fucose permease